MSKARTTCTKVSPKYRIQPGARLARVPRPRTHAAGGGRVVGVVGVVVGVGRGPICAFSDGVTHAIMA